MGIVDESPWDPAPTCPVMGQEHCPSSRLHDLLVATGQMMTHSGSITSSSYRRILYLPPYFPFLNRALEFFSAWRLKVHELIPQFTAVACGDVRFEATRGVSYNATWTERTQPEMWTRPSGPSQIHFHHVILYVNQNKTFLVHIWLLF